MVPSEELAHQLSVALGELQQWSLDTTVYQPPLRDVVFELTSFDAAVAGIATTLTQGQKPARHLLPILHKPMPLHNGYWTTEESERVDISQYEEVLQYVNNIVRVRELAQSLVSFTSGLFA
jgi:hypothetical protein